MSCGRHCTSGFPRSGMLARTTIACVMLALGLGALPASAAQLRAAPTAAQPAWVAANGGQIGAVIYALARDPDNPDIRYAGTDQGFARSLDKGRSWQIVGQDLPPMCQIYSLLIPRQTPATIFAGCGSADYANGLYRSDDRGLHWRLAGTGMVANVVVNAMVQSISDPATLLAATTTGIYRSSDGGQNWSLVLRGTGSVLGGFALSRDPFAPLTYYALVSNGVVKSVDGGLTWFAINNDLGGVSSLYTIVTDPTRKDRLFLGTDGSGIYRSLDGGNSWSSLENAPKHAYALLVQPLAGVPRSQLTPDLKAHLLDELAPPPKPKKDLSKPASHVPETALILAGTDNGVQASLDGGDNWSDRTADANNGLSGGAKPFKRLPENAAIYALLSFGRSPELEAGGYPDGAYRSQDLARSWSVAGLGLPHSPRITALAVDPAAPGTVYVGTDGSGVERSQNSGGALADYSDGLPQNATINALLLQPQRNDRLVAALGAPSGGIGISSGGSWSSSALHGRFVYTVIADPRDPDTLYAGLSRHGVAWSADGGQSWRILHTGLPPEAAVLSLAADPHNALHLLAGTDTGLYISEDQGDSWVAAGQGLPGGAIPALLDEPTQPHAFLAGTAGGVYRSVDGGTTWTVLDSAPAGVHALVRDPLNPSVLLAATTTGIYRSADDGATWTALRDGIPAPTGSDAVAAAGPVDYASTVFGTYFLSPTGPVPPAAAGKGRYFALTGHSIQEPFLSFWQQYGGGAVFGPPRTEAILEGGLLVQYFQRARLEYHAASGLVTLSPLGSAFTKSRLFEKVKPFKNGPARIYLRQTHHSLAAPFLDYWRQHGGPAVFGYPISEVLHEPNGDGTGNSYVLQYFQNARIEIHPENKGTPFEIQLGLLGDQLLLSKGWLQQ